jgi:poly(beta-D-mannuronate) lyase
LARNPLSANPTAFIASRSLTTSALNIKPGDEIIVVNGTYAPWSLVINTRGTAAKPVTVRAETTGSVIFSGEVRQPIFKLTGSYTILQGMHFIACTLVKVEKQTGYTGRN